MLKMVTIQDRLRGERARSLANINAQSELAQEVSEREIQEIIQGQQISELEIQGMIQGQELSELEIMILGGFSND